MSGWSDVQEALKEGAVVGVVFWNNRYPIGTMIYIHGAPRRNTITTTRSEAKVLGGEAGIWARNTVCFHNLRDIMLLEEPMSLEALRAGAIK